MSEHKAPPFLLRLMSLFFWAMALVALAFWMGGAVWRGGLSGADRRDWAGQRCDFRDLPHPCGGGGYLAVAMAAARHAKAAARLARRGDALFHGLGAFGYFSQLPACLNLVSRAAVDATLTGLRASRLWRDRLE